MPPVTMPPPSLPAEPAVALTVPLVVEAKAAGNWDDAH